MKHADLTDHIKGSYLKKQYLEAFLVQSAYIESLLKLAVDYSFWDKIVRNIETEKQDRYFIRTVNDLVESQNLNNCIHFLKKTNLIDGSQASKLHAYREKRNKILHDLVKQMNTQTFEIELKEACNLGIEIVSSDAFIKAVTILEHLDISRESESKDQ
jgi:hypothetical protein